jgi:hypothetical protein
MKQAEEEKALYDDLDMLAITLHSLEDKVANKGKIQLQAGVLGDRRDLLYELEREAAGLNHELELAHREFDQLMPDICPLCGSEVK